MGRDDPSFKVRRRDMDNEEPGTAVHGTYVLRKETEAFGASGEVRQGEIEPEFTGELRVLVTRDAHEKVGSDIRLLGSTGLLYAYDMHMFLNILSFKEGNERGTIRVLYSSPSFIMFIP